MRYSIPKRRLSSKYQILRSLIIILQSNLYSFDGNKCYWIINSIEKLVERDDVKSYGKRTETKIQNLILAK